VGLAQYTLRQYDEAEASFEAVRAADPYRLQCMDTYSNILYVKVRPRYPLSVIGCHIERLFVESSLGIETEAYRVCWTL
jgi:hypothetical protein